jgi:hypothetical protein
MIYSVMSVWKFITASLGMLISCPSSIIFMFSSILIFYILAGADSWAVAGREEGKIRNQGAYKSMAHLLDCQLQVELVDVVEGHLVTVTSEDNKILVDDDRTVAVSCTGTFPYDDIGVILKRF